MKIYFDDIGALTIVLIGPDMGRHINKWAKLNFVARHCDTYVQGHKGHNGVRQNSSWPIC